jgi:hypothetical protein
MSRVLLAALLLCSLYIPASFACECGAPGHASSYVQQATMVFVGKVIFTDDDGTGQFIQHTLIHFEVEEAFKGLAPEIHDIWIDPGSCTSCYAEFKLRERHLVFAYGGVQLPKDSAAMSVANDRCRSKPLPAGIDLKKPPKVYLAPECSGTREITSATESAVAKEIVWLKKYKTEMEKAGSK